jgi:DNA polymerase-4
MTSVRAAVTEMTAHAHRRLLTSTRAARTVTVKVRGTDFTTRTRSETAVTATTDLAVLVTIVQRLVIAALPAAGVRLIGVSLSGLTSASQQPLFDEPSHPAPSPVEPLTCGCPELGHFTRPGCIRGWLRRVGHVG